MNKIFAEIRTALDTLLNGAIARGDMLPRRAHAKITFYPADEHQLYYDTFKITGRARGRVKDTQFWVFGGGCWWVDIGRERDPAHNGEVIRVFAGWTHDVGADADEASCRELIESLHGAVLVEGVEAREAA